LILNRAADEYGRCAGIEASPLYDELRRAFEEGLVEPGYISRDEFDLAIATAPPGETLRDTRENRPPIGDVAEEIAWWAEFAAPKVGRNDPCPCGSGKKFKKCCGK
jgi:hypothetical protein